jgi:hypothetical protein
MKIGGTDSKIGGTGFNLSPANFQKPTRLSAHGADFHRSL